MILSLRPMERNLLPPPCRRSAIPGKYMKNAAARVTEVRRTNKAMNRFQEAKRGGSRSVNDDKSGGR